MTDNLDTSDRFRLAAPDDARRAALAAELIGKTRTVPDWPAPGVQFRDITPLLADAGTLAAIVGAFADRYRNAGIAHVAGLEARGFILAPAIALAIGAGFIPVRKKGKLPWRTVEEQYQLEYGTATVEIHADACAPGERVLLIDDLIATGGTMMAALNLLRRLGADVVEGGAIVRLPELGGAARLQAAGLPLFTLCDFAGH
ncbi:adenine phosphoribosyltransferase [Chitinasiproducens palmae]|uniref:Adenine phosphoribosyltransferase n=1 Tax=Chitinasiproducens palmae TaxID=1770053 RepID=A0A1H2PQD4_9BURK|nr:adenine phosphoribosyltransferase [Chitinasiproducens palmae]SDV48198.1 adenine phosphoribosyltransferase [Chitinasiproducens palmae]